MNESPDDRIYSQEHIWLLLESDSIVKLGITDFAQSELGDIVYVELPKIDNEYESGQVCAIVESVKTASDVYIPVSGKVIEINEDLSDSPELINESPYGDGWICEIELRDKSAIDSLMNASQYDSYI